MHHFFFSGYSLLSPGKYFFSTWVAKNHPLSNETTSTDSRKNRSTAATAPHTRIFVASWHPPGSLFTLYLYHSREGPPHAYVRAREHALTNSQKLPPHPRFMSVDCGWVGWVTLFRAKWLLKQHKSDFHRSE